MNTAILLNWVEARLMERSTWLGFTALLTSFGVNLSPANSYLIGTLGMAAAGAVMVFTKDHNVMNALVTAATDIAEQSPTSNGTATASVTVEATPPAAE